MGDPYLFSFWFAVQTRAFLAVKFLADLCVREPKCLKFFSSIAWLLFTFASTVAPYLNVHNVWFYVAIKVYHFLLVSDIRVLIMPFDENEFKKIIYETIMKVYNFENGGWW